MFPEARQDSDESCRITKTVSEITGIQGQAAFGKAVRQNTMMNSATVSIIPITMM